MYSVTAYHFCIGLLQNLPVYINLHFLKEATCQLNLAIPPWVGAMNTSESWDINRHTA